MTALIFTLKKTPTIKLNCGCLTPNNLAGLSLTKIKNINFFNTNSSPKVSDFFEVSGENSQHIVFKNTNQQLDYIGHKMTRGQITIEDDCGDFLGSQMRGGSIICHGNANDRIGDQMRRGLILIDGNAGEYCGSRMIAGTIGIYGHVASHVGFAMKRGTILLTQTPKMYATIQDCGTHTLPFLTLLFKSFSPFSIKLNATKTNRAQRYTGDIACNGNGEILVLIP